MLCMHVAMAFVRRKFSEHQHMREGDMTDAMSSLPQSVRVLAGVNSVCLGQLSVLEQP